MLGGHHLELASGRGKSTVWRAWWLVLSPPPKKTESDRAGCSLRSPGWVGRCGFVVVVVLGEERVGSYGTAAGGSSSEGDRARTAACPVQAGSWMMVTLDTGGDVWDKSCTAAVPDGVLTGCFAMVAARQREIDENVALSGCALTA